MKTIKTSLLVFAGLVFSMALQAQHGGGSRGYIGKGRGERESDVKISVQYAYFKGINYINAQRGSCKGIDIAYFLTHPFFIAVHFNQGSNRYYEDKLTIDNTSRTGSVPVGETNATLIINNIGLLGGVLLPVEKFYLTIQMGFSQYMQVKSKYPLKISDSDGGMRHVDDVSFSAAFPLKASVGYRITQNIEIEVAGGFYINPDYFPTPCVGIYCGPQISVSF
jgi:hypothetical protein